MSGQPIDVRGLDASADDSLRDREGKSLNEVRREAGFGGNLDSVRLPQGAYHAFLELHIEQGPLLERQQIPIGVVTAISAPASLRISIEGEGGHAGAVLMPDRHDAFLAAEIALLAEAAAKATGSQDTVATAGICEVFPGAVNSIPSRVRLELDGRDIEESRRATVLAQIARSCEAAASRRGVTVRLETVNADPPAQCEKAVTDALRRACRLRIWIFWIWSVAPITTRCSFPDWRPLERYSFPAVAASAIGLTSMLPRKPLPVAF